MKKIKKIAEKMVKKTSKERAEAEKMMGCALEEMTAEQRALALACLAAFEGKY